MEYISRYTSPLGEILLAGDETGLTGLWFEGQKYYAQNLDERHEAGELPLFAEAKRWLGVYFSGENPDFTPPLRLKGTPFQIKVWQTLRAIPYGETVTYGDLARRLSQDAGGTPTSPRAVGGAVGRNPISLIVPCHRVVGVKGQLTGYAGGLERKARLLRLEQGIED